MPAQVWPRSSFFGFFASASLCDYGIWRCQVSSGRVGKIVVPIAAILSNGDQAANHREQSRMDDLTRTAIEAAVFRRLAKHLRERTDVQNIEMMIAAGFCRNCLGDWFREAAAERHIELGKDEARAIIYGMPPDEWKFRFQKEATAEQKALFAKSQKSS
jgi:hypothetical protein